MVSLFFPYILKYEKPVKQIGFAVKLLKMLYWRTYREVGKYKAEWAMKIGQHMKINENRSPSFQLFIEALLQRLNTAW